MKTTHYINDSKFPEFTPYDPNTIDVMLMADLKKV